MADKNKALNKLMAQCARRELCTYDAREKLRRMELSENEIRDIISQLTKHQFIDDERYTKAFVREKLEINHWGWTKIKYALRMKGIPDELIAQFSQKTDQQDYTRMLDETLRKKLRTLKGEGDVWKLRAKLIRFAASRGFEPDLIYERVDALLKSDH